MILPTPDGPAFPLEFAFAAPEYLPDESLLGLIARAGLTDLEQWLDELRAIVGTSERESFPSLLSSAAEVYRLLTDHAERLATGLDESARAALEELGPADGLVGRRAFLAKHAPGLPDGPWLPYRIPESCPASLRQLFLRGLLAPSGSAWQPGVYLHIPTELRPAALRRHYLRMEERANSVLAASALTVCRPGGSRISVDGPALLRHTAGALAAGPLRLTQKGQIPQADLERLAKVLGVRTAQVEASVLLASGLGLVTQKDGQLAALHRQEWPDKALPARKALTDLTLRRPGQTPSGQDTQDFLSFLRIAALESLARANDWLAKDWLQELLLTKPGLGRWLEYFWGREERGDSLGIAVARTLEILGALGAAEIDMDPGAQDDCLAARILPWGLSLLAAEVDLPWPPAEPLVVTANHEVYAPLGLGPIILARLGRLADLTAAGPAMVFRISRDSLRRAASGGVRISAELSWLVTQVRGDLPQNVTENLMEMANRQGEIRLAAAGGYLLLRNPSFVASLRQSPDLAPLILAEAGGLLVLVPGADLARLERELTRMGFLVEHPPETPERR